MKTPHLFLLGILSTFVPHVTPAAETKHAASPQSVTSLVQQLGLSKDRDSSDAIARLHQQGRIAVPLIAAELRIIDPDPDVTPEDTWWHMVWCERALRSITGQYFRFKTKEPLPHDLASFVSPNEPLGLTMEWMSHGEVFVAPRDVQAKVIKTWNSWIEKNGATFEIRKYEPYGDWSW